MENFFNYISKPLPPEDVDIWFKINNIIPEKMELYYDFSKSLYQLIIDTYLGECNGNETKIIMTQSDNMNHFDWCFKKIIIDYKKEGISFNDQGEHYEYFKSFFNEVFYNQKEEKIKKSIFVFFNELFDINKPFSKSDLDILGVIYKNLEKNLILY